MYTTRALIRLALTDNFSPAPPGRACYEQVTMGDIDRPGLEPQGPLRPTGLQPCFESAPAPRLTHRCAMLGFSLWGAPSLVLVPGMVVWLGRRRRFGSWMKLCLGLMGQSTAMRLDQQGSSELRRVALPPGHFFFLILVCPVPMFRRLLGFDVSTAGSACASSAVGSACVSSARAPVGVISAQPVRAGVSAASSACASVPVASPSRPSKFLYIKHRL